MAVGTMTCWPKAAARFAFASAIFWASGSVLAAQPVQKIVPPNEQRAGTVAITDAVIPFSAFASPQAREAFLKIETAQRAPDFNTDVAGARRFYQKYNDDLLAVMRKRFQVTIQPTTIGGVRADMVVPANGIAIGNEKRILINLHGGAFIWGAGSGALVESIPIAATGRIRVVAVDYRMAPEHRFPAASQDVAAVYAALLKTYRAEDIGIYGCSAGGILAAQSIAWFVEHRLPVPGAIASLCATGAEAHGDTAYLGPVLSGDRPGSEPVQPFLLRDLPYFAGTEANDALVFPVTSRRLLERFPPTLLLTGGRDPFASSLTFMHRELRQAGAVADLYLFDGLGHAYFMDPDLPESRETYAIITRFFERHLGEANRQRQPATGR